ATQKNGFIRSRILRASGPAGCSEFCSLFGPVPPQLASTTTVVAIPTVITAPRRSRCMRSNICLPSRSRVVGSASARRLYIGGFAGSQLCDSGWLQAQAVEGRRPALPVAIHPHVGFEVYS